MGRVDQQDEQARKRIRLKGPADDESDPYGAFIDALDTNNQGAAAASSRSSSTRHRYQTRSAGLISPLSTNSSSSSALTQSSLPPPSLSKRLDFDTSPSSTNLGGRSVSSIKELQNLFRAAIASGRFKKRCRGCGNDVQHCCGRTILEEISSIPPSP
ncbi:uncharacterized protein LOC119982900 [Tripterygium wilfordii]|uniref:uncharacterized protein LOC119982900 n=1 Tax=Tripterygium wilfordii TaxID=458696 RepID=UPI0018F7EF09|nr:uncharacterized protein LOC119982900 [Tripterygium wilfordii]